MKPAAIAVLAVLTGLLLPGCIAASEQVKYYSEKPSYSKGETVGLKAEANGGKFYVQDGGLGEIWRFDETLGVWQQLDLSLGPAQKQVCYSAGLGTKLDIVPKEKQPICTRLYSTDWGWNGEFTRKERKDCRGTAYDEHSRQSLPGSYKAVLNTFDDGECRKLNSMFEAFFNITA